MNNVQAIGIRPPRAKRTSRGPRGSRSSASPLLLTVAAAALFSAGVAGLWQWSSPPMLEPPSPQIDQALLLGPITQADEQTRPAMAPLSDASPVAMADEALSAPKTGDGASSEAGSSTPEQPTPQAEPAAAGAVPASERVTSAYFDDAAFVGDSITTGIKLYDVMGNADVFAATGVSLDGIFDAPVIKQNGESISIPTALGRAKPDKIYVMLGANSLGGAQERLIGLYGKFIDLLKKNHPDSLIYIQSVLPLYEPKFKEQYKTPITNEGINSFNAALSALATEKGVYYVDVASAFQDESGAMPAEYTPDGIHINSAQYTTWFDYLKTHAIVRE